MELNMMKGICYKINSTHLGLKWSSHFTVGCTYGYCYLIRFTDCDQG